MAISYQNASPVELMPNEQQQQQVGMLGSGVGAGQYSDSANKIKEYIIQWRNQLRNDRWDRLGVWNECWQLYRGQENWEDKEDWQSKIALPKAFSSVKMATNTIKRMLGGAKRPWNVEAVNPDDLQQVLRAEQLTDLTQMFLEKGKFLEEFSIGLECGFILGLGVWKIWWGLVPRTRTYVTTSPAMVEAPPQGVGGGMLQGLEGLFGYDVQWPEQLPAGQGPREYQDQLNAQYPTQLPNEALSPEGWGAQGNMQPQMMQQMQKQLVQEEYLEGQLFIRAVDPYNFYWLPGSKLNKWVGTIEECEVPKWELMELASRGVLDKETVEDLQSMKIEERTKESYLRFGERPSANAGTTKDTNVVKLTEYYGPIIIDGEVVEKHGHVILANDSVCLLPKDRAPDGWQKNPCWHQKAPYAAYSPLQLPFRTEGVGLIEMVRDVDKALNRLANLSMDTLMFRLMPLFEVNAEAFENSEDFETGMVPGKIFRRKYTSIGQTGITPVAMQDISGGAVEVSAALDRAHQEGSLISEIQQGIPRYRGVQTATEIQEKQGNTQTFFGGMAADIEDQAVKNIVEFALDLILQFIDTANDPRVASVLGVGANVLKGLTREDLIELVQGDYLIKVTGITSQLEKADMLQNLVQFMNLIGQNPQAWLPYINQSALLNRILEAFRPSIRDIENIIASPEMVEAAKAAMSEEQITPELLRMMPQLIQMAAQSKQQDQQASQTSETQGE